MPLFADHDSDLPKNESKAENIDAIPRFADVSRAWVPEKGKKRATFRTDLRSALRSVVQDQKLIRLKRNLRVCLAVIVGEFEMIGLFGGPVMRTENHRAVLVIEQRAAIAGKIGLAEQLAGNRVASIQ